MAVVTNYSDTNPPAPTHLQNVHWQKTATPVPVQIISITGIGPFIVTTQSAHGLTTGDVAFVQGGGMQGATGTWIVTVSNANVFSVAGNSDINATTDFRESEATVVLGPIDLSAYEPAFIGAGILGSPPGDGLGGAVPYPPAALAGQGYFLSADGTWQQPSTGGNSKRTGTFSLGSAGSAVINHNLGTTAVLYSIYDNGSPPNAIQAENVQVTDSNNITLIFGAAVSGFCVVIG